jgi:dGTP triphosphohydrolase
MAEIETDVSPAAVAAMLSYLRGACVGYGEEADFIQALSAERDGLAARLAEAVEECAKIADDIANGAIDFDDQIADAIWEAASNGDGRITAVGLRRELTLLGLQIVSKAYHDSIAVERDQLAAKLAGAERERNEVRAISAGALILVGAIELFIGACLALGG